MDNFFCVNRTVCRLEAGATFFLTTAEYAEVPSLGAHASSVPWVSNTLHAVAACKGFSGYRCSSVVAFCAVYADENPCQFAKDPWRSTTNYTKIGGQFAQLLHHISDDMHCL